METRNRESEARSGRSLELTSHAIWKKKRPGKVQGDWPDSPLIQGTFIGCVRVLSKHGGYTCEQRRQRPRFPGHVGDTEDEQTR